MTSAAVVVDRPADLDASALVGVAHGRPVRLGDGLLDGVADRRARVLGAIGSGAAGYGVTTGVGAQSVVELDPEAQARQSSALLLARASGGPPWLEPLEARAVLAARLRTLVGPDSGVGVELCRWLVRLLGSDVVPAVPRHGSGSAGEIIPLAHAFGHLGRDGRVLDEHGRAVPAAPVLAAAGLEPPDLGPKEGIALLGGVPVSTGLALLRLERARGLALQELTVGAAQIAVTGASRDPYRALVARADADLEHVLTQVRALVGDETVPRALQAPVSFRVLGPVLAQVQRAVDALARAVDHALDGVTDSPVLEEDGGSLVGTPGFHGIELSAAADGLRLAVVHAAAVATARLHRMLDPRTSGLPAQLAVDPGPQAGLVAVHKRAVGAVRRCEPVAGTALALAETSGGQEDVQSFAPLAMHLLDEALDVWEEVVACGLLAVHQALLLEPALVRRGPAVLARRLAPVHAVLPTDPSDRPFGQDVETLRALLRSGWAMDADESQ